MRPTIGERLQLALLRAIGRLPARVQTWLGGGRVTVDGESLDPVVQIVRVVHRRRNPYGLAEPTPEVARQRFRHETLAFRGPVTPVGAVRDFTIPGGAGPLGVRHYAPDSPDAQPLVVYLHGGGWVIGDLDTHDEPCRILCAHARVHIVSVAYRLAPEHPFPDALDDTRAALRWAQAHAVSLGARADAVSIGGDSAGANLATVIAAEAARAGTPPVAQLLVYPPTDSLTPRPSQSLFGFGYFLSRVDREEFSRHYLGGTGATGADPRVSPLLDRDLAGRPPAFIVTAGFDLLRDEGEAYATALAAAGTPVQLERAAAFGHGFIHMTGVSPAARETMERLGRDWRGFLDAVLGA